MGQHLKKSRFTNKYPVLHMIDEPAKQGRKKFTTAPVDSAKGIWATARSADGEKQIPKRWVRLAAKAKRITPGAVATATIKQTAY